MHKSKHDLNHELEIVLIHQVHVKSLVDFLEDEDPELEMSDYQHKATITMLERLHDVLEVRVNTLSYAINNYDPDPRNEAHYFGDR